jgi:hypothetical protein
MTIINKKFLKGKYGENVKVVQTFKVSGIGKTNGRGLWSRAVVSVPFTLEISDRYGITAYEDGLYSHAHAVFEKKDWDVNKLGLIYTDSSFLKDVQTVLKNAGIKQYNDIGYSEQGAQGNNFVDLCVGSKLLSELVNTGKIKIKI